MLICNLCKHPLDAPQPQTNSFASTITLMKKRLLTLLLALIALSGLFVPKTAQACDRSSLTYDSLVVSGSNYILYVTLCIGTGRNGIIQGGDLNTGRISFGFYDTNPGFTISAVAPSTITPALYPSTSSYSTAGAACPPGVNPFGWDCGVNYNPTVAGRFLGCITTAVDCGDTATQCWQFSFTFNQIPDSLRAYGVEGGNIATNGCYPNPDMALDLSGLPVVWGSFMGSPSESGVNLNWITYNDQNDGSYVITRSENGLEFAEVGAVASRASNENKYGSYEFFDPNPNPGLNYYRLLQTNSSGTVSSSEVVTVVFDAPASTQWNFVSPVPTQDFVTLSFRSPSNQAFSLQVFNTKGELVHTAELSALLGTTETALDMSNWNSGFYFVRLQGADGSILEKKVVKL